MTDSVRIVGALSAKRDRLHQIVHDAAREVLAKFAPGLSDDLQKALAARIGLRAHQVALRDDETGQSTTLAYLATPYSKYPGGIERAFADAAKLAARLLLAGVKVYSPICHTHPLAIYGDLDALDLSIWLPFDEAMMSRCDSLIVARLPSWETSKGIAHEIHFFAAAGKPIFDLHPESLVMTRRG